MCLFDQILELNGMPFLFFFWLIIYFYTYLCHINIHVFFQYQMSNLSKNNDTRQKIKGIFFFFFFNGMRLFGCTECCVYP